VKRAVILFNLGGPDSLDGVEPFLRNLFSDPAVISLPGFLRKPLARFIAKKRGPVARDIYAKIGGRSPILENTLAQARALEAVLGENTKAFIAMRCSPPFADEAAKAVAQWGADKIVLLPLYPQFSTTTTGSALKDWQRAARAVGLAAPTETICCYPEEPGFLAAVSELTHEALAKAKPEISYRVLFSAHGLPQQVIDKGDPYQHHCEKTAAALAAQLGLQDWTLCYQSRVGPLKWIGPATDAEIRRAGQDGKGVVMVPIAFVSEHSETLVELDIEYGKLAAESGVPDYLRVPAVGSHSAFIAGLAALVSGAGAAKPRLCPSSFKGCIAS